MALVDVMAWVIAGWVDSRLWLEFFAGNILYDLCNIIKRRI